MEDRDIIKALECCSSKKVNACDDCPFHAQCYNNDEFIEKEAIDLINRQKAEIERFKEECSCLGCENEWLKAHYERGKAEAVKEFAERFESKLNCIPQHHFTLAQVLYDLDKTKKEMVGEG